MKTKIVHVKILLLVLAASIISEKSFSQDFHFGLYAEPLISWFSSDTDASISSGARPGIAFGITLEKYFARSFAFTGGVSIINASGRLRYSEDMPIYLKYETIDLEAGNKITYKIRYLAIPAGIKLRINWLSYTAFSASMGLSPKVILGGKGSIPSHQIEKESISDELKLLALGFFINLAAEYPIGERAAVIGGLGFDNIFTDVTTDHSGQPKDKITHNIIRFRVGLNF